MHKNRKGKRKVRHELKDDNEYAGLSDVKNIELNGEMISEKEYMRRFNSDWYYGKRHGDFEVIDTPEGHKEAIRNNNRNSRDVLSVAQRSGTLSELTDDESAFMKEASNEWEWQDVYKYAGPERAREVIFEQAKLDIEEKVLNVDLILSQFVIKMMKWKTLNERKRKQKVK